MYRYSWYYFVRSMIRAYPERKRRLQDMKEPQGMGYGESFRSIGKVSQPTEDLALRELPQWEQKEYDAVEKALQRAKELPQSKALLEMIRLMYWSENNRCNLHGAAIRVNYSYKQAQRLMNEFEKDVAENYGCYSRD